MATRPVVLYDANVLYPAQLRDFLMHLAVNGLVRAHWSETIHAEWMRNVHADYPDIPWEALERTRRLMDTALPDALVEGYQHHITNLQLPDEDDRHVLAAALHVGADAIITFNISDFPREVLDEHGLVAIVPDTLVASLYDHRMEDVVEVARQHRRSLRRPTKSVSEYLKLLAQAGLEQTTMHLQTHAQSL